MTTTGNTPASTVDASELRADDTVHTTWGPARVLRDPEPAPEHPALVRVPLITPGRGRSEWTVRADRQVERAQD